MEEEAVGVKAAGEELALGDGHVRKHRASMLNTLRADMALLLLFKELV